MGKGEGSRMRIFPEQGGVRDKESEMSWRPDCVKERGAPHLSSGITSEKEPNTLLPGEAVRTHTHTLLQQLFSMIDYLGQTFLCI